MPGLLLTPNKDRPAFPRVIVLLIALSAVAATAQLANEPTEQTPVHVNLNHSVVSRSTDEWNGGPRECDLANGIDTACYFQD